MTQAQPGWYPDPSPENVTGYGQRYWDGTAWTEHVHLPAPQQVSPYPAQYPAQYPVQYPVQYVQPGPPVTPDGQPLAGWWQRVLAQTIDGFIVIPILALALAPQVASQWDNIHDWFQRNIDQAQADNPVFSSTPPDILNPFTGPGLAAYATIFGVNLLYQLVFLRWKQATPGKLVVGLRIRLRESPDLPWSAILPRVGFVLGLSLIGAIPIVGTLGSLAGLVDYLWPLGNDKKQALHDKIAATNVVKVR